MRSFFVAFLALAACSSNNPGGGDNDSGTGTTDSGTMDEPMGDPDTGPPPCDYPAGPYGYVLGSTVSPGITWQGYAPNDASGTVTTLKMTDLYDCDGRFGINAILLDEAALWCGPCQQEAMALPGYLSGGWTADGVRVASLVVQDLAQMPASTANALTWRNQFKLNMIWVAADPGWIFSHMGTNGLPMNVLIDPRTMKITKILEGFGGEDPAVDALAKKNKTM
jgi:hypothetical protein